MQFMQVKRYGRWQERPAQYSRLVVFGEQFDGGGEIEAIKQICGDKGIKHLGSADGVGRVQRSLVSCIGWFFCASEIP